MKLKGLLGLSLAVALTVSALPASAATDNTDINTAYSELIEKIHDPESESGGFDSFKLIYVNNDDVPELLAVHTPKDEYDNAGVYSYAVYTYYNGKAVNLGGFSSGVASAGGYRGDTSYIPRSGKIYETYISSGSGEGEDIIHVMKKGALKKKAKGEYSIATETQKWNGKEVSAKKYSKKLKKAFNSKKAKSFEGLKTISYKAMMGKLS
ncbi:MAG: hypothetical protein K6F00_04620 [Lachnospiraceae bacterium]|nr:hypothetical protein [Lachnospiraceae bacterium]